MSIKLACLNAMGLRNRGKAAGSLSAWMGTLSRRHILFATSMLVLSIQHIVTDRSEVFSCR